MTTTPPAGLYTVPLGSTETLRKGVAKLQFKFTSPVMKKAADLLLNRVNGAWNSTVLPAVQVALRNAGVTNIRLPSANFYANSAGVTKAAPLAKVPAGFKYYARKGYDPATGIGWIWVVVS